MKRPLRIAIIGGDAAGMSAASKAKRVHPECVVTVFERGNYVSYAACGTPYWLSGTVPELSDLFARTPEQFANQGIQPRLRSQVVEIQPRRHFLIFQRPDGQTDSETYDKLIIATGAQARPLALPGHDLSGVFSLRSIPDALAIRTYLTERSVRNAVIVGGGYIGLEMLETCLQLGLRVTLIHRDSHLMSRVLDPEMAEPLSAYLRGQGMTLMLGEQVTRFEGKDRLSAVVVTSGSAYPAELAVVGIGTEPNVTLARDAGIELGKTGAIRVDNALRTSAVDVHAAGDCAEARHLVSNRWVHIPLGTTANKQGRIAGANAAGDHLTFDGVVGTAVCKVVDLTVARTGLTESEARQLGFDVRATQITAPSVASYYDTPPETHVRLLVDRRSRKLLGGQLIGPLLTAKRVDTVATALHAGMTIDTFAELDLSYAPPYSPVWDPLLVAANVARGR